MAAAAFYPSIGPAAALRTQLKAAGTRCAHYSSPIRSRIALVGRQQLFSRNTTPLVECRSNFHSLPQRPALPAHDVAEKQLLQRTLLGHSWLGVRRFSQSQRRWRYSYQRFDSGGRAGRAGPAGFPENKFQRIWRVYQKHIIGGGTVVVGFYVYNLEEVPVCTYTYIYIYKFCKWGAQKGNIC